MGETQEATHAAAGAAAAASLTHLQVHGERN